MKVYINIRDATLVLNKQYTAIANICHQIRHNKLRLSLRLSNYEKSLDCSFIREHNVTFGACTHTQNQFTAQISYLH